LGDDRVVNRRYTIRKFDAVERAVTIDVSLHGTGPGTDWIAAAHTGDRIDAIGPRGKITLRPEVDWHLFVVDETGLPGALAMLEALPAESAATAPMLEAVAGVDLPTGVGHAYVAAEAGVVRGVSRFLTERGLRPDQISGKAYWRRGLPNAEHGEPTKEG
jgi:NADPH-dependent ferric siderophore reductase